MDEHGIHKSGLLRFFSIGDAGILQGPWSGLVYHVLYCLKCLSRPAVLPREHSTSFHSDPSVFTFIGLPLETAVGHVLRGVSHENDLAGKS